MIRNLSRSNGLLAALWLLALLVVPSQSLADKTKLEVRVLSKGAKFIGSSMGGVQITIRDMDTGELLAQGVTSGGTGDTARIMQDRAPHHSPVSSDDAAAFATELDLDRATRIEVTAYGPLAQRQAAQEVSLTQWVVPGKHITGGDALRLEMPGLVVDVLAPATPMTLTAETVELTITAHVALMCGCPITPNGLWDANQYEVSAIIERNGAVEDTVPLNFAGEASLFSATVRLDKKGSYHLTVYAYDPANGNTGVDFATFAIK
jgi:hypothetical protein